MRQYDHHDPDCNVETWGEEMQCESEFFNEWQSDEDALQVLDHNYQVSYE